MESLGTCYVELALTIPVLLFLAFGTLELSNLFRTQQVISGLCREGANAAFRKCANEPDMDTINACLENEVMDKGDNQGLRQFINTVLPGAEIVLSVYKYDSATQTVSLMGVNGLEADGETPNGHSSKYAPGPVDPNNPNPATDMIRPIPHSDYHLSESLMDTNQYIAISEVFYKYNPRLNSASPLFKMLSISFYEVSIF